MKNLLASIALLGGLVCTPVSAVAQSSQPPTGSRLSRGTEESPDIYAVALKNAFKHCYYKNYPERADAFLAQTDPFAIDVPDGTVDRLSLRSYKWSAGCQFEFRPTAIQSTISFQPRNLRAMLTEAAYLARFPDAQPAGMAPDMTAAAPDWNVGRKYFSEGENLGKARFFGDFSDCIVAKDPVGADRLLRTEMESAEEREAAMAMVDALGACLVAGNEITLQPENIRSFAADGLWQRYIVAYADSGDEGAVE